jgi:ABC-type branched-subunit amino acid transport system ATPase component/branched-subunit amino acid ABC-type transport system permease component
MRKLVSEYLLFLVLGLASGAVYAALSLGVVVTYQGTGVINFAAAAMVGVPLYVMTDLEQGQFTLPIPWLPSFDVGPLPTWVCVVISLLVAAVLAVIVEVGISRQLRNAPALAKVVAAVGIMLTLQAALGLKYGTNPVLPSTLLPSGSVRIGGADVGIASLSLIGITVVLGSALAVWFRKSRAGLAIQASAENERAASFARLSPYTLGMITWVLASVFTALIMILAGPATGALSPSTVPLLVVPALAGALIARLRSLWVALIGSLVLGVVESELQFLSQAKTWWPSWGQEGLTDAVPFVVIVIALFLLGRAIPTRGDDVRSGLPPVIMPKNRPVMIALLCAGGVLALVLTSGTYRFGVITSLGAALIALSLVVLTGMVGQISLAQAAFAGLAGLVVSKIGTGLPFPLPMIIAALIATVAGVLVGIPALRIRGAQLAVVTLAAGLAVQDFVFGNPALVSATTNAIPNPGLFGLNLAVRGGQDIARVQFGLLVLAVVVIAFVLVSNVMRGGTGRKMLAVRSNERAAAAVGIDVSRVKLYAFALSSLLAGLGGALIGYSRGQLSAESFGVLAGLSFLTVGYVSGITSVSGALLAGTSATLGIVYVFIDTNLHLGAYYSLLTGLSLILTVIFNPMGIAGRTRSDFDKFMAWRRAKRAGDRAVDELAGGVPVAAGAAAAATVAAGPAVPRQIGEVILRAANVSVRYGGVQAVDDVSIEVRTGEIVGLIGANGAGKTSFVDALTGFTDATGEVYLGEVALSGKSAHARARHGLVRTWQAADLFDDLPVVDNIRVGTDSGNDGLRMIRDAFRPSRPAPSPVDNAIATMALDDARERRPGELPLARQKAVGIARSLAMHPRALLFDEPAAGLDTTETVAFGERLRAIAASGVACLLIDHDMQLVMGVCDRVYVIEFGRQIATGTPDEVRRDPRVLESYLGSGQHDHPAPAALPDDRAGQPAGQHASEAL